MFEDRALVVCVCVCVCADGDAVSVVRGLVALVPDDHPRKDTQRRRQVSSSALFGGAMKALG